MHATWSLINVSSSQHIQISSASIDSLLTALVIAVGSTVLLSDADDTASRPAPSIPCKLALLVSALAQIVRTRMYHDRASEDALGPYQLDVLVRNRVLGIALAVGLEVS